MKVIVIGGGPSGMMCAAIAAKQKNEVILIEKNEKLGKKLYITGKGRANVTNYSDKDNYLKNIINNPKFLMSAYYAFTPIDTINFYEDMGVELKVERGNRVFPKSDKSSDIINAHIKHLNNNNVKIMLNTKVKSIIIKNSIIKGVILDNNDVLFSDKVVVATGGISYKSTGSTGDGYTIAKLCGHSIIEPRPALISIELNDKIYLEGLSLKNVTVSIFNKEKKKIASEFGEMLFTATGVSGPTILTLSSRINKLDIHDYILSIDLKPALSNKKLDDRILRDFNNNINKDFINSLHDLLPKNLIPEIIIRTNIDPRLKVHQIDKGSRLNLINIIKNFNYTIKSLGNIDKAIVTAGGVNVKEINPKTMQSKFINGLYFIGEVIDVDGLTGGYNIQIALSTGYLAANSMID